MKGQGKYVLVYKTFLARYLENCSQERFRTTILSTYDFSTLSIILPHNLIKEKCLHLTERPFKKIFKNEGMLYLAYNDKIFSVYHFYRP